MGNCAASGNSGAPGSVRPENGAPNGSVEEIILSASYAGERMWVPGEERIMCWW